MAAKPLRFASWIRVSTEQQAKQGESLRTQKMENEACVEQLGGTIVAQYGGQEHATEGWEKQEFDRMLQDASRNMFDAIIMNHNDRWSRDGRKHFEGRDILKAHGIKFFVRTTEYDLDDDDDDFRMGIDVLIAQRNARIQNRKSLKNKIERARRNVPCSGSLPFGRTFDSKTEHWGVISAVKSQMEDIATRYLAGESLYGLADEYGVKVTTLYERMKNCGSSWTVEFHSEELKIHETVDLKVPALLNDETIRAIRKRAQANTTFSHGHLKHRYLFSRMVFCQHCGSALSGQCNSGLLYYRHLPSKQKSCIFEGQVRADDLESAVMVDLFEMFGNPVAVIQAIQAATPNLDEANAWQTSRERALDELEKIKLGRNRLLDLIAEGALSKAEAAGKLDELKQRETRLVNDVVRLEDCLQGVPSREGIKAVANAVSGKFQKYANGRLWAQVSSANDDLDAMTWEERRALAEMVFGGKTADGNRMGIYVQRIDGQRAWKYAVRGHLIERFGEAPMSETRLMDDPEYGYGFVALEQDELFKKLSLVTRPGPWVPIRRRRYCHLCRSRRRGGE